jgi:AAA domain-containing protein
MTEVTGNQKSGPITDAERLQLLQEAFIQQKVIALREMKHRGIATVGRVCQVANVDRTYLYDDKKSSSVDAFKALESFRNKVLDFADEFKEIKAGKAKSDDELSKMYSNSLETNLKLTIEKNQLRILLQGRNELIQNLQLENTSLQAVNTNTRISNSAEQMNQNMVHYISPDRALQYNEHYHFYDVNLRKKAWFDAKAEFSRLMLRKLPMRVYILIGLPCSGKTTWSDNRLGIKSDRHSVIIDATNLTMGDRAQWLGLARRAKNVKTCAVRFLVDFMTVRERNELRESSGKRLELSTLESKHDELEEVDIGFEDFDEMLIVREC